MIRIFYSMFSTRIIPHSRKRMAKIAGKVKRLVAQAMACPMKMLTESNMTKMERKLKEYHTVPKLIIFSSLRELTREIHKIWVEADVESHLVGLRDIVKLFRITVMELIESRDSHEGRDEVVMNTELVRLVTLLEAVMKKTTPFKLESEGQVRIMIIQSDEVVEEHSQRLIEPQVGVANLVQPLFKLKHH